MRLDPEKIELLLNVTTAELDANSIGIAKMELSEEARTALSQIYENNKPFLDARLAHFARKDARRRKVLRVITWPWRIFQKEKPPPRDKGE